MEETNLNNIIIGYVKWYDYHRGFGVIINYYNRDEYFIHQNIIPNDIELSLSSYESNKLYVCYIGDSKRKSSRIDVKEIILLEDFQNIEILNQWYLQSIKKDGKYFKRNSLYQYLGKDQKIILFSMYFESVTKLFTVTDNILQDLIQISLNVRDFIDIELVDPAVKNKFLDFYDTKNFDDGVKFQLWKNGYLNQFDDNLLSVLKKDISSDKQLLYKRLFQTIEDNQKLFEYFEKGLLKIQEVYNFMSNNQLYEYLQLLINNFEIVSNIQEYNEIINYISRLDIEYQIILKDVLTKKITNDVKFELWLNYKIEKIEVEVLRELINHKIENGLDLLNRLIESKTDIQVVFEFIYNHFLDFNEIKHQLSKNILEHYFIYYLNKRNINDTNDFDKILAVILSIDNKFLTDNVHLLNDKVNDKFKILLWLKKLIDYNDFSSILKLFGCFDHKNQRAIIRKLFKDIDDKKCNLSLVELMKIVNLENYDERNLIDHEVFLVINILKLLYNKDSFENINLFIVDYLQKYQTIKVFKDFYVTCKGRTKIEVERELSPIVDESQDNHPSKQVFIVTQYSDLKKLCEGRKVKNKGQIVFEKYTNLEFNWCRNNKCFVSSFETLDNITKNSTYKLITKSESKNQSDNDENLENNNFENYDYESLNLLDFCRILNIEFDFEDHSRLNGFLNRINDILNKMICRECNNYLMPAHEGNYGIYRVSLFRCSNKNCSQYLVMNKDYKKGDQKVIYLSHCINPNCQNIIDSRDSDKCPNGWYICNNCFGCCSVEKIQNRYENLVHLGQRPNKPNTGHKDIGEMYCFKCGGKIIYNKFDKKNYDLAFKWLLDHSSNKKYISKSGINKFNKHWWLLSQNNWDNEEFRNKVINLKNLGFEIPDFYQLDKSTYLISGLENPNLSKGNGILICSNPNCDNEIDLNVDVSRSIAITKFHDRFFGTNNVQI